MNRPRLAVRLQCRPLEDRTVPAVGVTLTNGVLNLTGDGASDDVLITVNAGNNVDVTVNGSAAGSFRPRFMAALAIA